MYVDSEFKDFIHNDGYFKIKVPFTWRYTPPKEGEKVHTFSEYEIWKTDAFQVSIFKVDERGLERFKSLAARKTKINLNGQDYFTSEPIEADGVTIKIWMALIDQEVVTLTLTCVDDETEKPQAPLEDRLEVAERIVSTFQLVNEKDRESEIKSHRFATFLQGIGASSYMLDKAVESKSFIEATCLLASQVDGLLRTGIVLKKQLDDKNSDIDLEWIYQGPDDRKKSEKDIYNKALELGVISKEIFNKLFELYEDRNRVIHRFIISEITIAEVEEIAYHYYLIQQKVNGVIFEIEKEQIEKGVGMTTLGETPAEDALIDTIKGKIGKQDYFQDKELK
jgi:hypothetical protein